VWVCLSKSLLSIAAIAKDNGMDETHLNYALLFVSDMSQFAVINAAYTKFFGINPPPRYVRLFWSSITLLFKSNSGNWLCYLTDLLSLRLVGQ